MHSLQGIAKAVRNHLAAPICTLTNKSSYPVIHYMQRAPGGPKHNKKICGDGTELCVRTKCGVRLNPLERDKDQGQWTIRVEYEDDENGKKVNPRVKMINVKVR